MNPFAVAPLMLAAVNACVGGFYLLLYLRRREPREHLPFAALCFTLVLYDIFCSAMYSSRSLEQGVFWQRWEFVGLALVSVATIWFLVVLTGRRLTPVLRLYIFSVCVMVLLAFTIERPGITLSTQSPAIKVVRFGSGLSVTYHESEVGIVYAIAVLMGYMVYGYLVHHLYRAYRKERSRYLLAVIIGQGTFIAGLMSDGLVATGVYSFIYVGEYAYMVVIMTMGYALLSRFVDVSVALERLNSDLERRIAEAVADIKVLRGLIPICANCKKVRDDEGYWSQVEVYIQKRSDARFSHHICPECVRRLYPDLADDLSDTKG